MHPNPAFRTSERSRNIEFASSRAFGVLAVNADSGPLLSHIPFLLSQDGASADLHLVRSNPIARMDDVAAVISVSGPDGYVSPDWYGMDDQVPTWNYVAVHLRGRLKALHADQMHGMLDRQSAFFEARLAPKRPWATSKMSLDSFRRMLRQILPFRLLIDEIQGTWKLNQNKPAKARLAAADKIGGGFGLQLEELQKLMREAD